MSPNEEHTCIPGLSCPDTASSSDRGTGMGVQVLAQGPPTFQVPQEAFKRDLPPCDSREGYGKCTEFTGGTWAPGEMPSRDVFAPWAGTHIGTSRLLLNHLPVQEGLTVPPREVSCASHTVLTCLFERKTDCSLEASVRELGATGSRADTHPRREGGCLSLQQGINTLTRCCWGLCFATLQIGKRP